MVFGSLFLGLKKALIIAIRQLALWNKGKAFAAKQPFGMSFQNSTGQVFHRAGGEARLCFAMAGRQSFTGYRNV